MKKYLSFNQFLESLTISELVENVHFDYEVINGLDNEVRELDLPVTLPVGGYNQESRKRYLDELESANEETGDDLRLYVLELIENSVMLIDELGDVYRNYLACLGYSLQEVA